MKKYPLLEKAPLHDSPEFIDYLRENNVVEYEDSYWIIIQNCKYHSYETPWLTAFTKTPYPHVDMLMDRVVTLKLGFENWEWLKKAKKDQSVERFHIHLIKR